MTSQTDDTIRRMRVMRARTGHWRSGGFGADVLIALNTPTPLVQEPSAPARAHLKQRGATLLNMMLLCATMMVG